MEQRKIEYTTVDITSVQTHPKNVRQGDIGAIAESLKAHGQYRPIVVDKRTNYILAGNHTWKAAQSLGWSQISAGFVETKDDDEALRILLSDNRASDLATYDDGGLAEILKQLAITDTGLVGTMYDGDDLDDLVYRLGGSLGFVTEGNDISAIIDEYADKDTRNLTLPYTQTTITQVKEHLTSLQQKTGIDNWSEIVLYVVKDFDESH
jgi:hypothetical protein